MDELARPAIEVVERDEVRIVPDQWKRVYLDWMREIRPWCISRQLWWGHRIPVWYCDACEETFVAEDPAAAPDRCGACGGELRQEEDVLDTWFSSALWPFATLGWPEETQELRAFYPTSFLTTAREIIFLWVARMVMTGLEVSPATIPFRGRSTSTRSSRRATGAACRRASAPGSTRWRRSTCTAPTPCALGCWRCPRPRTCATPTPRSSRAATSPTSSGTLAA